MKNKNLHNNEGFGEARLCLKGAKKPVQQETPKPDIPDPHAGHEKPAAAESPGAIEDAKKKVAQEAEKKKKELKAGVEGKQERAGFREAEGLPDVQLGESGEPKGLPLPLETTKPRTTETEEEKRPKKAPDVPPMSMEAFMKHDLRSEEIELVRWRINVTRENYQINWQNWDHSTAPGIDKIYEDCQNLTIINTDKPFYDTMFAVLKNSADKTINKKYRNAFLHPLDRANHELIAGLPADGKFPGGEAFLRAYGHLLYLKSLLNLQDQAQKSTADKQRKATEDPVASRAADFFHDNLNTIKKAVRERDLSTLAMYGVGFYALWSTLGSKLFGHGEGEKGEGFDFKHWFLIGAAAYCGNTLLKNAGYDVFKMVGFKDSDAELHGTPMEVLPNILQKSEYSEEFKDLDANIVLAMGDTSLVTLENLRKQSNSEGGIKFIHPREFPNLFPDLKNAYPFKMGQGEEALRDTTGMYNTKLSAKEKEYVRVGQQVYKLALAMAETYNLTLHQHHKEFIGKTYDEALADSWLKQSKVRHLTDSVGEYAVKRENAWFSGKKPQEIEAKLNDFVKENAPGEAFAIHGPVDGAGEGAGDYKATFHGFPVVVSVAPTGFRVYLRNVYGQKYNTSPGPNYIAEIPLDGGAGAGLAIGGAVKGVTKRVEKLLEPFDGVGGRSIVGTTLVYQGGKWQAKVTLPGASKFDIKERETVAIITPDEFGDGVALETEGGVRINIKESLDKQYPIALALIPKIVDQKEFRALAVFNNAGLLRLEDLDPNDTKVTLVIGKNRMKVEIEYAELPSFDANGSIILKKVFIIAAPVGQKAADVETSLIQNPAFAQEYIEALDADEHFELNKTASELKELIKQSCPEKFLAFFFQSLANQTLRGPLKGFNTDSLSGTIPDNFTNMIIDTKKQEAFNKLYRAINGATNLQTVEALRKEAFADLNTELVVLYDDISRENRRMVTDGEEWGRTEFMLKIVDKIRNAGTKSTQYSLARADFEYTAYNMDLPGIATLSDFNEVSHFAVGKLINVFTFHTAYLDSADLDNLTYPPRPSSGHTGNPKEDPALRGHYILNYFEHVKDRIVNEAPKITGGKSLNPDLIPGPSDPRWKIESFENWGGTYEALDPLDNKLPFEHDLQKHSDKDPSGKAKKTEHTELDLEFKRRILEAKAMLESNLDPTDLNIIELEKYLDNKSGVEEEIGLFNIYKNPVTGKPTSKIWEDTNPIDQTSGGKRSVQIKLMNQKVNEILDFIFNAKNPDSGTLRFFIEKPGIWEKLKKTYYRIRYKLNI